MDTKIDDGIPIPHKYRGRKKYPLRELQCGQSFFVPDSEASRINVQNAAYGFGKEHGRKFTVAKVEENGVRGCRVWRIA